MIEVGIFPLAEILPGRAFFKKGDYFSHFYFIEDGRAIVTISQTSIEVSGPIFLGDYEISAELDHRTSTIKAITRCRVRTLPEELYPKVSLHHEDINAAFRKYSLKTRLLSYWLRKLFVVGEYARNKEVACSEGALGVVLRGEFRINSNIPICKMKQPNLELRKRFEICAIGEQELFEENVVCETHRGTAGVMESNYTSQLAQHFEEFKAVMGVVSFKHRMHVNMSQQIALNCRKKYSIFQNMVPSTLKSSIKQQHKDRSQPSPNKSQLSKLATSQDVFSVKDNISQFLHKQWRHGLSLKLPKKQRRHLKLETIRKKHVQEFVNPQMISLSIPRQFKEVKFNFKMLLRTKDHAQMRSRRVRTEPIEEGHLKLLFRD